ncbi:MAG TPA: universal stress protein [Flavobacteriaceae bacterium]|jgi:nucleotide-binding universal stress UspA family protein|nr:universal stress protein [Flavobacteriaceae bacterium]HBS11994.1 universal stress protein [Flavobacteriaceae bacterium]
MKKLILPTDFSENATNAINYAQELFANTTCTFYLLNTYTPMMYSYDYQLNSGAYIGEVLDMVKENSLQKLEELKQKLQIKYKNPKHQFELISSFNLLTDELDYTITEYDIDLIIMGTKGASGLNEILFGSNTIHVIKKVKCPVLAIPDGFFFEKPKDILFPTDYKIDYSNKHLNILKSIAKEHQSAVHTLHVSSGRDLNDEEIKNKNTLEKLLLDLNNTFYTVKDQEIPQAINEFQKSTYVHLLMMIRNKHTFLENLFLKKIINQIGFHLTIPFLVVPSKM